MARRHHTIAIDTDGRDQGKVFVLHEMPATQAEKWAAKAFLALAASGVDVPENIMSAGLLGWAHLGIKALSGMSFADAEPLLDEMFGCVAIIPDPQKPQITRGCNGLAPLVESDIEEVSTRVRLRMELFKLHLGFSEAGNL